MVVFRTGFEPREDTMDADTRVEESFAGWLYRPYFDLGAWKTDGNPHTRGLELAREAVVEQDDRFARLHTTILPSARHAIIRHTGLVQYLVDDPVDLDPRLRTPAWQVLCDQLGVYEKLDAETRVRLLWLLHRLCMHAAIVEYETSTVPPTSRLADGDAAVLFMRGQAGLSLFRDGKGPLSLERLEHVADAGRPGCWGHVEATYLLAQFHAKYRGGDTDALREYLGRHRESIEAAGAGSHEFNKLMSRHYRMVAFLPQLTGDHEGMSSALDEAERRCGLLSRGDASERAEWDLLHSSLYETRTKEKLVRGDLDLAMDYASRLVELTPADPHPRLELGEVQIAVGDHRAAIESYRWAALLGPHVIQVAEFMIGQCMQALGDRGAARAAYVRSLDADPLAISTATKLVAGGFGGENGALADWAANRLATLRAIDDGTADRLHSYQRYEGGLGRDPVSAARTTG